MKILCIVSSQPGHMDFGGQGFTRLVTLLEGRGHQVEWLSFGHQPERLSQLGFTVKTVPEVRSLSLLPLLNVTEIDLQQETHQFRLDSFKTLHDLFCQEQPDLFIIDRLLTYAPFIAEQLKIPYVVIGTPGGYWDFERVDQHIHVFSVDYPINRYKAYGECLKYSLDWGKGEINSFWASSSYLNICFMNHDFYPLNKEAKKFPVANVYHHKKTCVEVKKQQLGISFGNQGDQQLLLKCVKKAVHLPEALLPIHVFVGSHEQTYAELESSYTPQQITLYRWVDFNEHFSKLSCLIFLGGIGTIWQCIEHSLPMLIIPGNIGDQYFNAEQVLRLGLGLHLKESDLDKNLTSIILQCLENPKYQDRISAFRSEDNYTDTLVRICEKIEEIHYV